MVHDRFAGFGQPAKWIAADIVRIENGIFVEHWDVIQDEATAQQSKGGKPMFGERFPEQDSRQSCSSRRLPTILIVAGFSPAQAGSPHGLMQLATGLNQGFGNRPA
jgi:hypothetical protein